MYSISWFWWWVLARGRRWEQDVSLCHFSSCTLLENLVFPVNIPKIIQIAPFYFPIISMNPKFSPNKRETKNKASEIPLLQSWDQPELIVCNVWRQMTFKTSILPKGQYRDSQFPIMLCRLPMIQTSLRQSALFWQATYHKGKAELLMVPSD